MPAPAPPPDITKQLNEIIELLSRSVAAHLAAPDYTHQLNQIVQLLSKREIVPTWLLAIIVGWILCILSTVVVEKLKERWKVRDLRRGLCLEIGEMYHDILHLQKYPPINETVGQQYYTNNFVTRFYEFAISAPDLFHKIGGFSRINKVYRVVEQLKEKAKESTAPASIGPRLAKIMIEIAIQHKPFSEHDIAVIENKDVRTRFQKLRSGELMPEGTENGEYISFCE